MAKDLHNVIRLGEWRLDGERQKLADKMARLDDLEDSKRRLAEEYKNERQVAVASPEEAGFLFGNYMNAVLDRRQELVASIAEAEDTVAAAREELRLAYMELRKFETAQANREKREAEERDRKETLFLDEIGMQGHRRRKSET